MTIYEKSTIHRHVIDSNQVLCCEETGRVIAVFYNGYDLDEIIERTKPPRPPKLDKKLGKIILPNLRNNKNRS